MIEIMYSNHCNGLNAAYLRQTFQKKNKKDSIN